MAQSFWGPVLRFLGSGGGALSDGDYGDITVSGGGTVMDVDQLPATDGTGEANKIVTLDVNSQFTTASGTLGARSIRVLSDTAGNGQVDIVHDNDSGNYSNTFRFLTQSVQTTFEVADAKNTKAPLAFGKVLAYLDDAVPFNGNTAGATSETTILSGSLVSGYARPGGLVALQVILDAATFNGADSLTIKAKIGGVTISTSVLVAADVGLVTIVSEEMIQAIGVSGKSYYNSTITAAVNSDFNSAAATPDYTASRAYSVTAQWSSNNAGNTASFVSGRVLYS